MTKDEYEVISDAINDHAEHIRRIMDRLNNIISVMESQNRLSAYRNRVAVRNTSAASANIIPFRHK